MGLDKRCQKRHCRHLGVVGMAVGRRLVWSSPRWNAGPKQNGHHVYTPRAVLCCLVGLVGRPWLRALLTELSELSSMSWGVVAACTRLGPYLSASSAALGFAPLLASSSASSMALLSESSLQGGRRHRPWHHPSSMQTPPRQLPCVKPPSLRADIRALCGACHIHALLRQRPLPRCWWRRRSPRLGAARR